MVFAWFWFVISANLLDTFSGQSLCTASQINYEFAWYTDGHWVMLTVVMRTGHQS